MHMSLPSWERGLKFHRCRWLCKWLKSEVSKVVPIDKLSVVITLVLAFIFLHEDFNIKSLVGCILIAAGTLIMVL